MYYIYIIQTYEFQVEYTTIINIFFQFSYIKFYYSA